MSTSPAAVPATVQHQTFWQRIKADEHSFLAWWAKEFAKFRKGEPQIVEGLDALTKYAVPALDIAVAAAGGPAGIGAEAAGVIAEAQTGLSVASSLVDDFGPTPTAASVYGGIQSNLSGLLALDGVKNPTTVSAITKVVNLVGSTASAISAAGKAATPGSATPAS
ncbi:MAG TPA: hypothetical protein VFW25_02330 [Silvibacterium sp.]|nr:hypothetical protein [Silvibacterium sp.]